MVLSEPTSGGTPIRIVVTINEDKLRSKVAAATLATGERLSAGQLHRLAANHDIIPTVLGTDSVPIDLGRSQRLFSKTQRDLLAVMDGGCTAPGCDQTRPYVGRSPTAGQRCAQAHRE